MQYPEEIREKYNECMYQERDIIEKFLKDQYDIRYGRQRDTWHFKPAVKMFSSYGNVEYVTDIMLDKDRFVVFLLQDMREYECSDFAYGELSKVIKLLPDADFIVMRDAINDLGQMTLDYRIDLILNEHPFVYTKNNFKYVVTNVFIGDDGTPKFCGDCNGTPLSTDDTYTASFVKDLRDHINVEVLHSSHEYKRIMELLEAKENLRFECANYGDATFVIEGTDVTFDISSIHRDDKGNLTIYGNDIDADICDGIKLEEKEIRPRYLEGVLKLMEKETYNYDIINVYNAHNPELVRKINTAWKSEKYHDRFPAILLALLKRDKEEFENTYSCDVALDEKFAMENAHEIMEGMGDDWDLETILSFVRYEE